MDSFVKYFMADNVRELEQRINEYVEYNELKVTAISIVPSHSGYFEAIVALEQIERRTRNEKSIDDLH